MGVQERKAREKEELRQEILDAATELFVEQGYEAVSMRKIAERIEYSPTTIYLYFRDKQDLFDNICGDTLRRLVVLLQSVGKDPDDAVEALRNGLMAYIRFGLEHPSHYRVTFLMPEACQGTDAAPGQCKEVGEQAFGCLVQAVTACVRSGQFRPVDPKLSSEALWAATHGLTSLLITHEDFPFSERDQLIDHLVNTLIEGLKNK